MMTSVSKRLIFDQQVEELPVVRKRTRNHTGLQDYRRRKQSICSESDCSLDGFESDDENVERSIPEKYAFTEVHLPFTSLPATETQSHTNINPFSPKNKNNNSKKRLKNCVGDSSVKSKQPSLSKISIKRYESEFLELKQLSSGCFGQVMLVRHRLDGIEYAVKISKSNVKAGSYEEKKALNEVFAHATLNSHKHVVRYYNSWVEDGQVYIQNEFCQGRSLSEKIQEKRVSGKKFAYDELIKILKHVMRGLQYIHSNNLVHLDIKPENIFLSSRDNDEGFDYKIGDLGHINSLGGESVSPEEGDCRYMAPEFLHSNLNHHLLMKADVYSLGLTLYEAASLKQLPRNSSEHTSYQYLKRGNLEYLGTYSPQFNHLLKTMVQPDPGLRPSATELLSHSLFSTSSDLSKAQLSSQIKQTKQQLERILMELGDTNLPREQ